MTGSSGSAPLRLGLTGGIASGKSLVASCFARLGVPVIDTDMVAREVVEPGQPALDELVEAFGPAILDGQGRLDRRTLRARVFADPAERHRLEGIVHPRIRARTLELADSAGGPYIVIVVPLLIESGFNQLVDEVIVVDCPEAEQRARLKARDGDDAAQADRMMAAQLGRAARLAAADVIIDNSGSISDTRIQVEQLHERYLEKARAKRSSK